MKLPYHWKSSWTAACLGITIVGSLIPTVEAAAVRPIDVPAEHWAWKNGTLPWALETGVVAPSTNEQLVRPADAVTETEALGMLFHFFTDTRSEDLTGENVYILAKRYNLPVAADPKDRTKPLTRGDAARLLAASKGYHYQTDSAIAFLYEHNLSQGKKEKTIEGFDSVSTISRVEFVQLLKVMADRQLGGTITICPPTESVHPDLNLYRRTTSSNIQQNLRQARTAYSSSDSGYWADTLYRIAKQTTVHNGKVRIQLPVIDGNKKIDYHVVADDWHNGRATSASSNVLEFPASGAWSATLIVSEGNRILGDMSINSKNRAIEINSTLIEKTE